MADTPATGPTPAPPPRPARARRISAARVARWIGSLALRLYALALIALIVWVSWLAFRYLIVTLIFATPPPPQVVEVPRRADRALFERSGREFAGLAAAETPRLPPSHFHRFDAWIQPDRFNGCTQSGCHVPLPHNRRKEDRAFLNMHATSLHCSVCHVESDSAPLPLTWYDLGDGRTVSAPAALRALRRLSEPLGDDRRAAQRELVELVREAAVGAADAPELRALATHLASVRAESEDFAAFVEAAGAILARHLRGEYGAKLSLADRAGGAPLRMSDAAQAAATRYLEERDSLDEAQRKRLLDEIHPTRRSQTLTCTQCHTTESPLVDLLRSGYPESHVERLRAPLLMQAIENAMAGRPFYLPGFLPTGGTTEQQDE